MEWADSRVWEAIDATDASPDERLRVWLVHIHVVQRAFLHVWTGRPVAEAFREAADFATLGHVREWAQSYYPDAHAFLDSVDESRFDEPIVMPWAAQLTESLGRAPGVPTLGQTCLQVTSHSTHHRGQVLARLRELGSKPPLVDYIAWIWFGKPAPTWTSSAR